MMYQNSLSRSELDAVIIATNETAHFVPVSLAERKLSLVVKSLSQLSLNNQKNY